MAPYSLALVKNILRLTGPEFPFAMSILSMAIGSRGSKLIPGNPFEYLLNIRVVVSLMHSASPVLHLVTSLAVFDEIIICQFKTLPHYYFFANKLTKFGGVEERYAGAHQESNHHDCNHFEKF